MNIGDVFTNNNNFKVVVIEINSYKDILVQFEDGEFLKTRKDSLLSGRFGKPSNKIVSGIGLNDLKLSVHDPIYYRWKLMLNRCYSKKYEGRNKCYETVEVCKNWWKISGYKKSIDRMFNSDKLSDNDFVVDKDILNKSNKIYSEETCCIVPKEINAVFIRPLKTKGQFPTGVHFRKDINKYVSRITMYGKRTELGKFDTILEAFNVYKEAKENHVKNLANKWRGKIDEKVYHALLNWEINIDD